MRTSAHTDRSDRARSVVRETRQRLRSSMVVLLCAMAAGGVLAAGTTAAAYDVADRSDVDHMLALLLVVLATGLTAVGWVVVRAVRASADLARRHAAELERATRTLEASTLETFAALNATVEAKDRYTAGHGLRVTLISMLIGQEMGLPSDELDLLRHAATFHDIGKIAVPDAVLLKPGRLTDTEFAAMQQHPVESARICSKLASLRGAVPTIRAHHERLDGRGYPDGLRGEEIPIGARIIAVADTWDAITSDRPYRRGQAAPVALDEVRRCIGAQFDPLVVEAFLEVLAKDPWMFGLTPRDLATDPAAPGLTAQPVAMGVPAEAARRAIAALVGARPMGASPANGVDASAADGSHAEPSELRSSFDSWFDEGDLAA